MPTVTVPTYEDAQLVLKLYELRREEKLRAARSWFVTSSFRDGREVTARPARRTRVPPDRSRPTGKWRRRSSRAAS